MKWLLLFYSTALWAEESGHSAAHADPHAIPWHSIFVQSFNFLFFFILIAFIMRKGIKAHFAERAASYRQLVERAEQAKAEAERNHREIQERLAKLEGGAAANMATAKIEAEALKKRMIEEARVLSEKLEIESRRSAQAELERAKSELRQELLQQALESSRTNLKSGLGSSDQKKLQSEFEEKIQVVGG